MVIPSHRRPWLAMLAAASLSCAACNNLADFKDSDLDGVAFDEGDCDDRNAGVFPGAQEVSNGIDDDCDGLIDEVDEPVGGICTPKERLCDGRTLVLICNEAGTGTEFYDQCEPGSICEAGFCVPEARPELPDAGPNATEDVQEDTGELPQKECWYEVAPEAVVIAEGDAETVMVVEGSLRFDAGIWGRYDISPGSVVVGDSTTNPFARYVQSVTPDGEAWVVQTRDASLSEVFQTLRMNSADCFARDNKDGREYALEAESSVDLSASEGRWSVRGQAGVTLRGSVSPDIDIRRGAPLTFIFVPELYLDTHLNVDVVMELEGRLERTLPGHLKVHLTPIPLPIGYIDVVITADAKLKANASATIRSRLIDQRLFVFEGSLGIRHENGETTFPRSGDPQLLPDWERMGGVDVQASGQVEFKIEFPMALSLKYISLAGPSIKLSPYVGTSAEVTIPISDPDACSAASVEFFAGVQIDGVAELDIPFLDGLRYSAEILDVSARVGQRDFLCYEDCGRCYPRCDDGQCDEGAGETCETCPEDCGACSPTCGDGSCDQGETCETCPQDCRPCDNPVDCQQVCTGDNCGVIEGCQCECSNPQLACSANECVVVEEDPCMGVDCNQHGSCQGGLCQCNRGYEGPSCNQCAEGYEGYPTCQPVAPPQNCRTELVSPTSLQTWTSDFVPQTDCECSDNLPLCHSLYRGMVTGINGHTASVAFSKAGGPLQGPSADISAWVTVVDEDVEPVCTGARAFYRVRHGPLTWRQGQSVLSANFHVWGPNDIEGQRGFDQAQAGETKKFLLVTGSNIAPDEPSFFQPEGIIFRKVCD